MRCRVTSSLASWGSGDRDGCGQDGEGSAAESGREPGARTSVPAGHEYRPPRPCPGFPGPGTPGRCLKRTAKGPGPRSGCCRPSGAGGPPGRARDGDPGWNSSPRQATLLRSHVCVRLLLITDWGRRGAVRWRCPTSRAPPGPHRVPRGRDPGKRVGEARPRRGTPRPRQARGRRALGQQ